MQYGMPLMFGVMSFFFPSGLTLYIFTNTCLTALHSIYMNKYDKKSHGDRRRRSRRSRTRRARPRKAEGCQGREREDGRQARGRT